MEKLNYSHFFLLAVVSVTRPGIINIIFLGQETDRQESGCSAHRTHDRPGLEGGGHMVTETQGGIWAAYVGI